jgi:hypothetical protein
VDDVAAAYVEPVAAALGVELALREPATDRDARVWVMGEHRIAQLLSKVLEHSGRRVRAGNTPPGGGTFDVVVETEASPALEPPTAAREVPVEDQYRPETDSSKSCARPRSPL